MSDAETTLRDDLLKLCEVAFANLEGYHHERCCGGDPGKCISPESSWREEATLIDRVRSRILAEWPEPAKTGDAAR